MSVRFVVALVLAVSVAQQTPPRDVPAQPIVGTATVTGVVLSGATGSDPARKARVMLNSVDGRIPGMTATTDDEGRFEFRRTPAGRFTVEAYKPGYLRAVYGAARPNRSGTPISIAEGGRVEGLTIRLVRGAAISGTVRSAAGRPVPGVSVGAYRYGYSTLGERRLSPQKSATTDDLGEYRLWGLPPGEYVVAASPTPLGGLVASSLTGSDFVVLTTADVDRLLQGARPDAPSPQQVRPPTGNYAPVFHPGTSDLARATAFTIAASEERPGIDMAIGLVRTARVVVTVTMPDGQPVGPATVTLSATGEGANLLGGSGAWRPRIASLAGDGRLTFDDVSPGSYRMVAQSSPLRPGQAFDSSQPRVAISEIAINGADVNVSLTMQPALTIAGRVVFDGASRTPDDLTALNVFLVPLGRGSGPINSGPPGGQVAVDGTFTFTDVTPGEYRMVTVMRTMWPGDWWPRSAMAGGRDVLDGPLKVLPGDKLDLALTYTDRPSEVSGEFQDVTGRPAPDYFIVIFPADAALRTPGSRRIRDTRPGTDGHYSVRGLPPGEYLLAALTDLDPEDLNTPSFFDQLAFKVAVRLVEGETTRQDLRVGR